MHSLSIRCSKEQCSKSYKKCPNPPLYCKSQDFKQRMHRMHVSLLKLKSQYKILSFLIL